MAAYPYDDLVDTNRTRTRTEMEYELIDTGVFDDDRYVDVDVEYAKRKPDDIVIRITVRNRSAEDATSTCCRRCGSATRGGWAGPRVRSQRGRRLDDHGVAMRSSATGSCAATDAAELLFTENETNTERLWGQPNASPYVKDAFHDYVVGGRTDAVNPARMGTKAAALHRLDDRRR